MGVFVRALLTAAVSFQMTVSGLALLDRIQTPPSNTTMYTVLTRAVTLTELQRRTDSANATPENAFTTDLPTAAPSQRTDAFVQQIVVRNTSADLGAAGSLLCYGEVAWAAPATTCNALCAASTLTCSGAATDGRHIPIGGEFSTREDGTVCGCVIGQGGGTAYQTHRITR